MSCNRREAVIPHPQYPLHSDEHARANGRARARTPAHPHARTATIAFLVLLSACLWRGYARVMTIHTDVLAGMIDKMVSIAEAGRRPSPNDMTEMLYPLERGRVFLRQYENRSSDESYRRFAELLDAYAAIAATIDDARTDDRRWTALRQRLPGDAQAVQERIAAIRTTLGREA
jgi:hypothetical protein